jgi:hypothetical protein
VQLTEQQLNYFRTFGFLIFRRLFSPAEFELYSREFNAGLDVRIGGRHTGQERFYASLMDADTPFITGLLDDARFADVAEQLLETTVIGVGGDSNYYVGDTQWHPDNMEQRFKTVKFTIYLDPMRADSGALRVIPGSHLEPFHSRVTRDPRAAYGVEPNELPAYVFESNPGDVLVFNTGLWHAAFGGSSHRRMGTIQFYEDPRTPDATAAFQGVFHHVHESYYRRLRRPWFPEYWRSIDNPRHQYWVRRLAELGCLETPVLTE